MSKKQRPYHTKIQGSRIILRFGMWSLDLTEDLTPHDDAYIMSEFGKTRTELLEEHNRITHTSQQDNIMNDTTTKTFLTLAPLRIDAAVAYNPKSASMEVHGSAFIEKFRVIIEGDGPTPSLCVYADLIFPGEDTRHAKTVKIHDCKLTSGRIDIGPRVKDILIVFIRDFDPADHEIDLARSINFFCEPQYRGQHTA